MFAVAGVDDAVGVRLTGSGAADGFDDQGKAGPGDGGVGNFFQFAAIKTVFGGL